MHQLLYHRSPNTQTTFSQNFGARFFLCSSTWFSFMLRLSLAGAFGHTKLRVDGDQLHVRRLFGIIQHVRPADGSDNSASPDFRPASDQGRRPLLSESDCESPTHLGVFLVQVPLAEGIGQSRDRLVLRADIGWNLRLTGVTSSCEPSWLLLVFHQQLPGPLEQHQVAGVLPHLL